MSKIIVTGGAGFIGGYLVKKLESLNHDVFVYDIAIDPNLDVRNLNNVKNVLKGADYVFHLAALISVPYSIEYPEETNLTNLNGTLNVLIAARDAGVKRVIFSSSAAVYGDQDVLPVKEDIQPKPKSPYAIQKLESEMYLKLFSDIYNLQTVSLRYFNVYGVGQSSDGAYTSVITKFIKQRKENKPITIAGDGGQTRDFINVVDIVSANILAMQSDKVGNGEAINIANGYAVSIKEIAEIVGGPVDYIAQRLEIKDSVADVTLAKSLLGWQPEVKLKDGISDLLK